MAPRKALSRTELHRFSITGGAAARQGSKDRRNGEIVKAFCAASNKGQARPQ
ncbi:MAG: hypothetical protein QOE68_365 [Thermoanaerobaculia bacterium]|nr:hypothetical protein [Thermoanaerobaculia bacterium]